MTTGGWQGDQGGGWNQDPYGQPQYGPSYDPYGQYQQDPNAGTGYQPYPGFGEPPPPPKKSKLPIVLSIIAIVAVVGGVVAIVLLNRGDDPQPAANTGGSSSSSSAPGSQSQSKLPGPTSKRSTSATKPPTKDGWVTVELTDKSGTYQVPQDWKAAAEPKDSGVEGIQFADVREVGTYSCGGGTYFRGFTASSQVQSKTGAELDVSKVVTDFATSFSTKYFNNPKIDLPAPAEVTLGAQKAAMVTAKLTIQPTKPDCEATSGEVALIGVGIENGGKVAAVRVLVVVNDLEGGPADPKALPDPLAEEILETLSLK